MKIKEIIAQFEEKRGEFATDLSCLENLEKSKGLSDLFNVYAKSTIVLLDRDADFVKTVFAKYASVIEILKSNIKFNQEDTFHFAIYYVDGRFVLFVGFFNAFFGKEKSLGQYFFNAIEDAINLVIETLTENAHEEQLEEWLEFE